MQSDWLAYNEYTTYVGIFMWVWLVDSWTWGHSWTCSIPTLVPILFSPVSHPYISWNLKKKFLLCLFVYFFDGLWPLEMVSLPPPASTLIFAVLCVYYSTSGTLPRSREESWKATVWSTSSVSEPESLRWLDSWLLSLIYKSKVYIIPILQKSYMMHTQTTVWRRGHRCTTAQHWLWDLRRILVAIM